MIKTIILIIIQFKKISANLDLKSKSDETCFMSQNQLKSVAPL